MTTVLRLLYLLSLILLLIVPTANSHAQQAIIVNLEFEYIRQGSVGVVSISGPDLAGGTLVALDRSYPFFPTSQGYSSLLAVPIEAKIQDYPITVTLLRQDGSTLEWKGAVKVASGQFVAEQPTLLPAEKLFLLRDDIQKNEDDKLLSTYSMVTSTRFWEGAFSLPLQASFSSPFGSWRIYNGDVRRRHTGQDLRVTAGMPVLASASGRVVFSRPLDIHGETVVIDHGWGVFSSYSHFSARYVVPGQFVLQGDMLGLSGNTGRSTGPHLHWEIAVNGVWVSPIAFLQTKLPN